MRDLKNNIAARQSIAPATYDASVEGLTVDRAGFESVTFEIHAGAWTDGTHAFDAEHSDDGSTWDAVTAADLLGTFPTVQGDGGSPETGLNENAAHLVGYIGERRYVRGITTVTGSPATGALYGVDVILGHAHERPTS